MNELCFVISSLSIMALQKDTLPSFKMKDSASRMHSILIGIMVVEI